MHGLQTARRADALTGAVYARLLGTAAVVLALDQVSKQVALAYLADGPVHVIPGAVTLRLTYNTGGAFGILQGVPGFFLVATIAVIGVILVWAGRVEHPGWGFPLGLVLGGGLGNLVDRVARDPGGRVVDFIDLHVWPVFNVADSAIVIGIGVILVMGARSPESQP